MNVKKGNDRIIELHDRLYSGLLSVHRNPRFSFHPHLTIGRFIDEEALVEALTETKFNKTLFETTISKIHVESIEESRRSNMEFVVNL